MTHPQAEEIARALAETRAATLELFDMAREEDLHRSPGFGFRPVIWHLAHVGVFEAFWLLQKVRGEDAPDERYLRVFDPIATPREESKDLPTRREMGDYLRRVRERSLRCLAEADFDSSDPLVKGGYVFQLVLEHERQHQETLAYLLHLLAPSQKTRPAAARAHAGADVDEKIAGENDDKADAGAASSLQTPEANAASARGEMLNVPAGEFEMGSVWDSFAYDNELPPHTVSLPPFKIARTTVTNREYARFVLEGGYSRREFWGEEGWDWRGREGWERPLYWSRDEAGGAWHERGMFEGGALKLDHPVVGVSWYEAEAYARFAGKRLPTEAEWEKAASWDARLRRKRRFAWGDAGPTGALCNFDNRRWGTTAVGSFPGGASPAGCLDMTGNVWEWTATPFEGFPGFKPFPYPEYSQEWFDGDHRVLKGGSWATRSTVLRTSFRNFFRRHLRIAFAGIRLAEDA